MVKHGFTLVELLVVISIIGILVGSASIFYNNAREKARDNKRKQDLAAIKGALALHFQDNGYYPCDTTPPTACSKTSFVSSEAQPWIPGLVSTYIRQLPLDPKQLSLSFGNIFANLFGKPQGKPEVVAIQTVTLRPTGP